MPNHIHPPVAKIWGFTFGCGVLLGHDPGCAALGPEARCVEIMMGRNKGNYLCLHPPQLAAALRAIESGESEGSEENLEET